MKVRLGDYITELSVRNKSEEDIPVYSVTNTQGFCTEYFNKEVASQDRSTYKIVPYGCFAYNPSRINVGSVDWQRVEDRVIVSPLYVVFKVCGEIRQQYLYYYLKSDITRTYIKAYASGSVRDNLKFSILSSFPIELRSIEEQDTIVSTLDRIQALIRLRQEQLQQLDELVKARFVEMFGDPEYNTKGWSTKTLGELCDIGSSKRIYQNEQSHEGVPFLRISDLVNRMDTGSEDADLYIPEQKFEDLRRQNLVPIPGDILLTARGTLGRCYIVQSIDRFYFQDGMITWLSHFKDGITPLYITHLFSMPGFRKQIDGLQAGSTVAYLSIAMTKRLKVMIPSAIAQERFASFILQIDKSKVVGLNHPLAIAA